LPSKLLSFVNLSASASEDMLTRTKFTLPLYFGFAASVSSCLAAGPHAGQKFW
jgi:hypothetical protein